MNPQRPGATTDPTCMPGTREIKKTISLHINHLPIEILLAIFALVCTERYLAGYYYHSVPAGQCSRISLMGTCRLWHNVVMDAPELWSNLRFCLPIPPSRQFLLRLQNILERSKDRPLSIELEQSMTRQGAISSLSAASGNAARPHLFPDLFSTSDRWVSLTVGTSLMAGSLLIPLEHSIPLLQKLVIRGRFYAVGNDALRLFDRGPSLRRLVLQPVISNTSFNDLWPRLTELKGVLHDSGDLEELLEILQKTPALRWLSVTSPLPYILHPAGNPVILPNVEVLRVENFFLLHLLATPVLKHLTFTIPKEDKTAFFRRIMVFLKQSACVLSTLEISQWNLRDGAQVHILLPFLANLCSAVEHLDLHFSHYDAIDVSNLLQHALGFLADPDPASGRWLHLRSLVIRVELKYSPLPGPSAPAPSCLTLEAIHTIRSVIEAPYRIGILRTVKVDVKISCIQPSRQALVDETDCQALLALLVDHRSTLQIRFNGTSTQEILG